MLHDYFRKLPRELPLSEFYSQYVVGQSHDNFGPYNICEDVLVVFGRSLSMFLLLGAIPTLGVERFLL
jgi:hypothetical protein